MRACRDASRVAKTGGATSHAESQNASARVAQLRGALLTGRGPGATEKEIAEHTRDRPLLGAVPPPVERALVTRQGGHSRAGEPITDAQRPQPGVRHDRRQAALAGAAAALLTRWLVLWLDPIPAVTRRR